MNTQVFSQTLPAKAPANLDFETITAEKTPASWQLSPASLASGYQFTASEESPYAGKVSGLLKRESMQPTRTPGILTQSFDAASYRGKRVRFRAAVQAAGVSFGQAQLWMRIDRKTTAGAPAAGFFDNMDDRPITSDKWQSYEIIGDVSPDAETINIGLIVIGAGSTRIDDASFEIMGEAEPIITEKARALSPRGLINVTAFTRLLGYIRYFHPSDQAARTDWESFAVRGMREVEAATGDEQLARKLSELFEPLAPTVIIYAGNKKMPVQAPPKEAIKAIRWEHRGVGISPRSVYSSTRIDLKLIDGNPPDAPAPFEARLAGKVSATIPLSVYADENGTLPHVAVTSPAGPQPTKIVYTGNDRATRLADVALAWNVFEHFYPYYEETKIDWLATLTPALTAAATDQDERQFENTLKILVSRLNDGHGSVSRASAALFAPPLNWDWIEGKLIVTSLTAPNEAFKPGNAVVAINGEPVEKLLREKEALISAATPQWKRYRALRELARGEKGAPIVLKIESLKNLGPAVEATVICDTPFYTLAEKRPEKIAELESGIYYINLDQITSSDFNAVLPKLEQSRGIIFDLRGYPKLDDPFGFFSHLSEQPLSSAQFKIPLITEPDHRNMQFQAGGEWKIAPAAPYLKARKVFITDGRAISYAESVMGIVENYKLGEIVGGPTAGTNGNINPFALPGGYQISWTGMKVRKHDGSPHHGVGILPTVPVIRTRAGVAAGRDEYLEKALELLHR